MKHGMIRLRWTPPLLLALAACGGEEGGANGTDGNGSGVVPNPQPPEILTETSPLISPDRLETTFEVDFKPGIQRLRMEDRSALLLVDEATGTYTFDTVLAAQAGLQFETGQPLLVDGLAVRRITGVSESGEETIVRTDPGTLEDVIQDGEIGYEYDVEFTPEIFENAIISTQQAKLNKNGDLELGPVNTEAQGLVPPEDVTFTVNQSTGEVELKFKKGDIEYEMGFILNQSTARARLNIIKKVGGESKARFSFIGEMTAPKNRLRATYADGELGTVNYRSDGLKGTLEFQVATAGSKGTDVEFPIPVPTFKYPILIGGVIPATIEYGAGFAVKTNMPGRASAQLSNTFEFDTTMGFDIVNKGVMTQSRLGALDLTNGMADLAAEFVSAGAGIQAKFPRVKLDIMGSSAVAEVYLVFELVGNISFGPVCQKVDLRLGGEATYSTSIFGVIPIAKSKEPVKLFDERKQELQDSCPM